jgi:GH24 family phage-related lysozyme (muramidase)
MGWGHLIREASCVACGYVAMSSKMPVQDAKALFENDVAVIEERVRKSITVPLYQYEFDALMSLAYNLGGLLKTPNLRQKLNQSDYSGAPNEFLDIENRTRRQREYDMFCLNVYNSNH